MDGLDETTANYLSEEVLIEILKRLPVKSLLRFRCVVKSWNNLIQSRMFITVHLNYQKFLCKHLLFESPYCGLLSIRSDDRQCEEDYPLDFFPSLDLHSYWYPISNNGLIYLPSTCYFAQGMTHLTKEYLWNPTIRKYKTLPDYPGVPSPSSNIFCWDASAFGFSSKRNDYLVVKIVGFVQSKNHKVMVVVYSLSTNSWKNIITDNFGVPSYVNPSNSVFIDGVAFWRAQNNDYVGIIVCFDSEINIMREISLPELPEYGDWTHRLGRCDQSLAFFGMDSDVNVINIWVMEGDVMNAVSWKKKISVALPDIIDCRVLGFRNNGEAILSKIMEAGLVSYNYEQDKINDFVDSWDLWSFIELDEEEMCDMELNMPPVNIHLFVESLEALEFLNEDCL